MNKRFRVVSIHPFTGEGCNLNCSFCYVKDKTKTVETKDKEFWYKLPKYLKKLTTQVACGSAGEPFKDITFIKELSRRCHLAGLLFNVTTNGKLLMDLNKKQLNNTLKYVNMVSISFDTEKIKSKEDIENYIKLVRRIKNYTKSKVSSNLLVEKLLTDNKKYRLINTVNMLFNYGIDSVYALCPKNMYSRITDIKDQYIYLTYKYDNFFVDDLTNKIIQEGYGTWKTPCHFFKDLISIDKDGQVFGCSFDTGDKVLLKLDKPIDLMKIETIKVSDRNNCPYCLYENLFIAEPK